MSIVVPLDKHDGLWLCYACGQMTRMRVETLTNCAPTKYCPFCAAPQLRLVKSAVDSSLTAAPLLVMEHQLRQLLYVSWREQFVDGKHPTYEKFVDFVFDALVKGELP